MNISQFKSLKELHEYYAVNNKCGLKKTATQPVYEIYPPSSGIVFIGEAPGKKEDFEGKPFVGSAGNFLDDALSSISLKRNEVYVTNVVKYRPPNNREPFDTEKNACRVWLNAELLFLNPKIIITLGKHALERFVKNIKISASHGVAFSHSSGIPIFAMYHPAVALYNTALKNTILDDFKKLRVFLDNGHKIGQDIGSESEKMSNKVTAIDSILRL